MEQATVLSPEVKHSAQGMNAPVTEPCKLLKHALELCRRHFYAAVFAGEGDAR